VAGAVGRAGAAGPQGPEGATGAQGIAGVVSGWTLYRDFQYEYNTAKLRESDMQKVSEIANYLKQNPSLKVGIDGTMDPRGTDPRSQTLSNQRISAIRDALIAAGVPKSRIQEGAFGDTRLTRDRRVAVLLATAN
jgi:outer membrane protein OmpA-like peptidoglycan-associated protein